MVPRWATKNQEQTAENAVVSGLDSLAKLRGSIVAGCVLMAVGSATAQMIAHLIANLERLALWLAVGIALLVAVGLSCAVVWFGRQMLGAKSRPWLIFPAICLLGSFSSALLPRLFT